MNIVWIMLLAVISAYCEQNTISYIHNLEDKNSISYDKIINTRGTYITSMCYTKTKDSTLTIVSNPCYSCHTKGKIPNYYNDTNLQEEYNFPTIMMKNPFLNLFRDRSSKVNKISDESILKYVRKSNYFTSNGNIFLNENLPKEWKGYRPDCYYNFDSDGFDKDSSGKYTLWRAFRYYPFLGTFWPTNGSTDDVLIRLGKEFTQDSDGNFDLNIYKLNLSIVEAIVKQKDIKLSKKINESLYGVDLNQNGIYDMSSVIKVDMRDKLSYVGKAKDRLKKGKIHLSLGLFPEGTEFLHSVRYIDWDDKNTHIKMSPRMKELRYAKKISWSTYSDIHRVAMAELNEAQVDGTNKSNIAIFRGTYEKGLKNEIGWIYQGFIESKDGTLRPQTKEETIGCMGCHSHLGATTDSTFSFARKLEGMDKKEIDFGWNHWSQKGLVGLKELKATYLKIGEKYEYSFYLKNNHSGNEFRTNNEVKNKFFDINGSVKKSMLKKLHKDISILLFPSKNRALKLNKGYKTMVEEQSFIYGRDANIEPIKSVYKEFLEDKKTAILHPIVSK